MKTPNFEDISKYVVSNTAGSIDLREYNFYNSDLIELIPLLSKLESIDVLDLSYNNISDFGALLLIAALKNASKIKLFNNDITGDLGLELSKRVWSHNIEITGSDKRNTFHLKTELANCSKKSQYDHNSVKKYLTEYIVSFYNNSSNAKPFMTSFLFNCVTHWSLVNINHSFEQLIQSQIMPKQHQTNERCDKMCEKLISVVKFAAAIERKIQIYKSYIAKNKTDEKLLLVEIEALMCSIDFNGFILDDSYNSLDLTCDLFDFFILRFNSEIDNSLFYGSTVEWDSFLLKIRKNLISNVEKIIDNSLLFLPENSEKQFQNCLKAISGRAVFTLHRNGMFRLLASFSYTLAGRTQSAINLDSLLSEISVQDKPLGSFSAAWNNAAEIQQNKHRLFQPQPIDPLQQVISAIRLHDADRVEYFLNRFDIINSKDCDGWSLIHHWAITDKNDISIFDLLVNKDKNIVHTTIESTGWNAAFLVINNCTADNQIKRYKLKILLAQNLDITLTDKIYGKSLNHYAKANQEDSVVDLLGAKI